MGEENKPRINDSGDNNTKVCQGRRNDNRRNRHRWNQGQQQGGKFKGKTKEIELDTFDNTGQHDAAQFNKSLKNIADYLQLNHGNNVSKAVRNLTPVNIAIPHQPVGEIDPNDDTKRLPVTEVALYLWKREHTKAQDQLDKYNKNKAKAYIIVFHQCFPSLKNDLKASDTFAAIRSAQDVIGLLKLVQSLCCSYDPKTIDNCLSLLNRWQPFKHPQPKTPRNPCTPANPSDKDKVDDDALVFAQDGKKSGAHSR